MAELDNRYSSNGKGNAGVALGVVGTALGGLATLGNGLWGGYNNGNCGRAGWDNYGPCSENTPVTRYDMQMQQELAAKDSKIALLEANTYNDQKSLELYKYVDGRFREFEAALAQQAVFNQKTADDIQLVRKDVEMEAERRCCADNAIVTYANATFYAKLIAGITASTADATPQSTYNPIPNCKPCCNGNNT
ncbi:MAG: hypothetical protein K2J72_08010 [Oscillospiraceae bacterium]|nr:hypothetical protein [Oscillospiraceae bacterium]